MTNTSLLTTRSSRMRNVNSKTSNLSLARTTTVTFNSELSSKADDNGDGLVYHRSDCGYPNVRFYGAGGRWRGSICGRWLDHDQSSWWGNWGDRFEDRVYFSPLDVVWYGDAVNFSIKQTVVNKHYGILGSDHNWRPDEIQKIVYDRFALR